MPEAPATSAQNTGSGCHGLAPGLGMLAAKVAAGELGARISWRGGWDRAPEAVGALLGRRLHGKAVIDLR
ncbi:hypothetical protein ACFTTN_27270 [Streptomyces niveus]|uniref:hypothetical protein n=1 Tax=Streptomyces niveus TaxID=193462 RepID=UPI0036289D36